MYFTGRSSIVTYLLAQDDRPIDVNCANISGNTVLHYVILKSQSSAVHEACRIGDLLKLQRLLSEQWESVNAQNNDGDTPLHLACSKGNSDMVETLMCAGADVNISNDKTQTPAQLAVECDNI